MIRFKPWLLALAAWPAVAALPHRVMINAVTDQYRPVPLDQQKLAGVFGDRIRAEIEGYLEHVDEKVLTANLSSGGKFLQAAATAYEYSRDPNLKAAMDRVAKQLFLIAPGDDIWTNRDRLLGSLAYYRVTGDEMALAVSKKIADQTLNHRNDPAAPTLIEPFVYLYRYTGEFRYLEFCRRAAALARGISGPLEQHLAILTGLLELYRTTGENSYYTAAVTAWPAIRVNHFSLFSSSSERSGLPDPCATAAWIQLTLELFRLTGQPQYGSELERVTYNQLFAEQDVKTGMAYSTVPLNGDKKRAPAADPCTPCEAIGISAVPSLAWGRYGNGVAISLYTAGRATFRLRRRGTIQLYSESTYPGTGQILIHVEPGHNLQFPLRMRVPEWTTSFVADASGSHLVGKPGEFLTMIREWKPGDTLKISIRMSVHVIDSPESSNQVAIQRGPQLLALGKSLNPQLKDFSAVSLASLSPHEAELTPLDTPFAASSAGDQAYKVRGEYDGKPQQFVFVPFADAVQYRLFVRAPSAASGATE